MLNDVHEKRYSLTGDLEETNQFSSKIEQSQQKEIRGQQKYLSLITKVSHFFLICFPTKFALGTINVVTEGQKIL